MEAEIKINSNKTDQLNGAYIELTELRRDPDYAIYYNNLAR